MPNAYSEMNFFLKGKIENKKVPDLSGKHHYGIPKGGIRLSGNKFIFDGKSSGIDIKNSKKINIKNGASYVAVVKFANMSKDAYDSVIFKKNQFVLSKKGEIFYCNFFNGKKWCAKLYSPKSIKLIPNKWYHLVLTFKHYIATNNGENWTDMKLYVNGRCIAGLRRDYIYPADSEEAIQIGKANGFGRVWNLDGAIAEIRMYDKTLSALEIEKVFAEQKFVKPSSNTPLKLSNKKQVILKQIQVIAKEDSKKVLTVKALVSALETIGKIRNSDIKFFYYAEELKKAIKKSQDVVKLLNDWNSIGRIKTINNKYVFLTYAYDPERHWFKFINIYDLKGERNLFRAGSKLWEINIEKQGGKHSFNSFSKNLRVEFIEKPVKKDNNWYFKLKWTHQYFTVQSQFILSGKRLEYDLKVLGNHADKLIKEVIFPSMKIKQLKQGQDILLVPKMSGVEYSDPVAKNISYANVYPSNYAAMQFGAYYDVKGGMYFAVEDKRAQTKMLSFLSGNKSIQVEYFWNVGFKPGTKNSFNPGCRAVFEIMRGNWYDAGLIYRRFLKNSKPVWWTKKLPREDTPEWFRNNSLWIRQWVKKTNFKKLEKKIIAARDYFEMPFVIHWYSWHGQHDQDYPHYDICTNFSKLMKRMQNKDIKVIPYINGRIWDTKDCGDEDWQYSKLALPNTVKGVDGKVRTSVFKKRLFAIMCPYTELWHNKIFEVANKVLGFGFNGLYWDQVAGASPVLCYDKSHGHLLGDCDLWFMKGNYKIFSNVRTYCKKKYPAAAFFSEDNAEPYSKVFDGALCWRWMIKTQVPLFQLIYSGRVQFIGLHYTHICESKNARYSKTAKQLVCSEQMGWFTIRDLFASSKNYKLFLKKAIHVRKAMLKFFNEGMLARPIKFSKENKVIKRKWGIYETSYVNSPEIVSNAWKYENTIAYLMVNTVNKKINQKIVFDSSTYGIKTNKLKINMFCSNGKFESSDVNSKFGKELSFEPYSIKLWIISPTGAVQQNTKNIITKAKIIFKKISNFSIPTNGF
jgi:hypothetical protein